VKEVGVIGAGTIGSGVTQVLASCGYRVIQVDITAERLDRARHHVAQGLRLAALLGTGQGYDTHAKILSRIVFTTDYDRLGDSDLVIENTTEDWHTKQFIYPLLDRTCRADCIFAANTSAIAISRLAALTERPDRVIGMHFMNPAPQKEVVEVVRSPLTSEKTVQVIGVLLRHIGKRAIVVNDHPGFVSSRVLMLTINEAIFVVQDNVASAHDVDEIFVKCFAHKMGPLATADLIGLDTVLRTLEVLDESYGNDKFRACPLLRNMVGRGLLGRKSGRGFFIYDHRQEGFHGGSEEN
jgi:3-hydroxybutyryl-CoA dehydrogenase